MKKFFLMLVLMTSLPALCFAATETPENKPASSSNVKRMAGGVKQVVYEGPKDFATETATNVPKKNPIEGTLEGVNAGTQKLLDHTVKGAYKVATFGTSELDSYEVEEPAKGSDETTKIKIKIPGT